MPKIIQVSENSIFIGYENGSLKEVKRSDCNFIPQVGDLVEVFSSETKNIVYRVGNPMNTVRNETNQAQSVYSYTNDASYTQQRVHTDQYGRQSPQEMRQYPQRVPPSPYRYAAPSYDHDLSLFGYFVDCITDKVFCFHGRARRKEYWAFHLFCILIIFVVGFFLGLVGAEESVRHVFKMFIWILLIPYLSVSVRRLHDCNLCGWFLALPFIQAYNACARSYMDSNRYGPVPEGVGDGGMPGGIAFLLLFFGTPAVGVLSVGVSAGYFKAMYKYRVNETMNQLPMIVSNIRTLFGSQSTYGGLSNESAYEYGIVTADMTGGEGARNELKNPFKGNITIATADGRVHNDEEAFIIEYDDLPAEACVTIVTYDWGAGAGSGLMGIAAHNAGGKGAATNIVAATNKIGGSAEKGKALSDRLIKDSVSDPFTVSAAVRACYPAVTGEDASRNASVALKYY